MRYGWLLLLPALLLSCGDDEPTGPKKGSYMEIDFNRSASEWLVSLGCQHLNGDVEKEMEFDWEQFSNTMSCETAYLVIGIATEAYTLKITSTDAWGGYLEFSSLALLVTLDGLSVYAVVLDLGNTARHIKPVELDPADYEEEIARLIEAGHLVP